MRRVLFVLVALSLAFAPHGIAAQDTTTIRVTPDSMVAQLTLVDRSVLVGRIVEVTSTSVRFASALGETTIPRSAIASVKLSARDMVRDGEVWAEDPSRTRLLFTPTGRMMHAGEAYLTDAYVFFPSIQYGVTDRFSIGVGGSLFPGVDLDENILYFTPKVGLYQSPKLNISAGAILVTGKVVSDQSPVGMAYGVATFGDENDSFTAGGGVGFANEKYSAINPGGSVSEFSRTNTVSLLMLGGSTRTTRNVALVTENYLSIGDNATAVLSGGVRFIGEKLSVDLALWGGSDVGTVVPYLAFIYKF